MSGWHILTMVAFLHLPLGVAPVTAADNGADTAGNEDLDSPAPGEIFFRLARFNSVAGAGQYGGSTLHRDRLASSGDCAP